MAYTRATTSAIAVLAMLACAAAVPVPTFPKAYSTKLNIVANVNGPQVASTMAYWQRSAELNATTYIGSQGHTVWNFGNGNNGNVYQISGTVCSCYCPITGTLQCNLQDSLCTYDMGHSAKFVGSGTMNGVNVNKFQWMEGIGPIPMNEIYLDTNAQTNAPVFQVRVIEPFGKYAGTENTTWTEFQVGNPPASVWEVPNKKYCQQCANCQDTAVMREMFLGMK